LGGSALQRAEGLVTKPGAARAWPRLRPEDLLWSIKVVGMEDITRRNIGSKKQYNGIFFENADHGKMSGCAIV